MNNTGIFPKWIEYYTLLLGMVGIGAGLTGYFAPQLMFSNITVDFAAISTATGMFAARNIAFGIIAFVAFFSKDPKYMLLLFVGRIITEVQDLGVIIKTEAVPVPAIGLILVWLIFFLLPEFFAIKILNKTIKKNE